MPDMTASSRRPAPGSPSPAVPPGPTPRALLVEGLRHHKEKRIPEALACYRRAVALDPGLADGWHMLGAAALQTGQAEMALRLLERSRHLAPADALLQTNLAHAWRALRCRAEAAASLATAIALDPARAEPWQDLGLVAAERRLHREAERCLAHAAHLRPDPAALVRHANALLAMGRRDRAEQRLTDTLSRVPDHLGARLARASARRAQGDPYGALADARLAVALCPDTPGAAGALGAAHLHAGQLTDAIRWRGRAARLAPGDGASWLALGHAAIALGPGEAAATALKRAIANDPALPAAYDALAEVRQRQGNTTAARTLLDRRLRLAPDPAVRVRRALHLAAVPATEAAVDAARERLLIDLDALERAPARSNPGADPLDVLAISPEMLDGHGRDNVAIMARLTHAVRRLCPRLDHTARLTLPPAADTPLRLVVLRPAARSAPDSLAPVVDGLISALAERTDLSVQVLRPAELPPTAPDANTPSTLPDDLDQARAMIAALRPDGVLAVDPMATPLTWALVFGRLAPVQAMVCGRPATTGLPTMDYVLTAQAWDGPEAQARHSERLIRLRGLPMRLSASPACADIRRQDLGLPPAESARLYLVPAGPSRFHPAHDGLWIDLLRRDTQGLLLLPGGPHRGPVTRLLDRWRRRAGGVDIIERVRVLPLDRRAHLLGLARVADCVLDTQEVCAGSTVLEALALGVPSVTLPGPMPGGQVIAGVYRQWGVPDLIARDRVHFVNLALRLARHEEWRREIGTHLARAARDATACAATAAEIATFFRMAGQAAAEGRRLSGWPVDAGPDQARRGGADHEPDPALPARPGAP